MRDIDEYTTKYSISGFEQYKVRYRRKKILEIIETYRPKTILEIGCGNEPLFPFVDNADFTIVEPSADFTKNAETLANEKGRKITIMNDFFENAVSKLSRNYDFILCASLLHEVEYPDKLINAIAQVCNADTVVCIIVPNAASMHRLLGMEMDFLADIHELSEAAVDFQQHTVFDRKRLHKIVTVQGGVILNEGGFFVKPFSHKQMYAIMQAGILDENVLDGLYMLGSSMPEFASEIYVNCKFGGI